MIAILVPTRDRAAQCKRMIQSVINTTVHPITIYLDISAGQYEFIRHDRVRVVAVHTVDGTPTAYRWNKLAEQAMKDGHKLYMQGADDMYFSTPLWDQALMEIYDKLHDKIHVFALRDSRDSEGTPHVIVTHEYIRAMEYFLPSIFLHWFTDTWTVGLAKINNCFTHLKDYLLIHDKPSDKGECDETHLNIRKMGWHDRDKALWDTCGPYFEIDSSRLKQCIVNHPSRRFA